MYMKKITREPHQLDQDWHPCFKSHRITRNCGGLIYFLRVKDKVVIPRDGYSCAEALFQAVQSLQVLYPQSTMQIA